MVKSMTGFGRHEIEENNRRFTVEIKAVNHRYLDLNMKMPKKLNSFESAISCHGLSIKNNKISICVV